MSFESTATQNRRRLTREFGARLRLVRKSTDFALWDAARMSDICAGRLSEMEAGRQLATPSEMDQLATALGCDRHWLETGDSAPNVTAAIEQVLKQRSGLCPATIHRVTEVLAAFLAHDQPGQQKRLGFAFGKEDRDG